MILAKVDLLHDIHNARMRQYPERVQPEHLHAICLTMLGQQNTDTCKYTLLLVVQYTSSFSKR